MQKAEEKWARPIDSAIGRAFASCFGDYGGSAVILSGSHSSRVAFSSRNRHIPTLFKSDITTAVPVSTQFEDSEALQTQSL